MSRLKVCFLLETFHPVIGGGEANGKFLTVEFVNRGLEVTVVTRHTPPETPRIETLFGATIHRIAPRGGRGCGRWLMVPTAFWWLLRNRKRWDVVLVSGFRALGIPAVLAAKLLGKKVVLRPQNNGEMSGAFFDPALSRLGLKHSHWLFRPFNAMRKAILKRADAFFPHTTDLRVEFLNAGASEGKCRLIYNPYDPAKFAPASAPEKVVLRKRLGIPEDALVGIFTGRLVAWKGPQHAVRMWHELEGKPENAMLLIVGPDGTEAADCSDEIRAYVREHKLEGKITMTGGVCNVPDYLRASDFFVFPSQRGEGCSNATIEAMACGLPIVTTTNVVRKTVQDHETALFVAPRDFQGFKTCLRRIIDDTALRARLGQAAAARARKIFASETIASEYIEVLEGLVQVRTRKQGEEYAPDADPSAAPLPPIVSTANSARRIGALSKHAAHLYQDHELKSLHRAGERLFRVSLTAGALLAWLFAVVLPAISIHILGSRLSSDHYALPAVGIFVLLMSITLPAQRLLFAAKEKDLQVKFVFTGVLMILALGVSLFHKFGINGVLAAILAGAMVVLALSLRALSVRHLSPFLWKLGGPLLGSLAAALCAGLVIHHGSARPTWAALGSLAAMCLVWLATDFIPLKHPR